MTKRIVVVASGRGSNFQAIIGALQRGSIPAECVALVTDNPKAYAIERAQGANIPVVVVDYSSFATRELYEQALFTALKDTRPDLVVLAGYMRIVGSAIVREYAGKMMNIHPALLPSFTGLHAQRQTIEYGVKVSGCTVHFVDEGTDTGPIIIQRCIPVEDEDDEEALAARILVEEHRILTEAVRLFLGDKIRIVGRRVIIR